MSQTTSGEACAHDKRTKREKERPERAVSPQPRATPWVSIHKHLRPVRAKVWANGWFLLLPIQVGCSKSRKSRLIKRRKRPCKGLKSRKIRQSSPTNNMRPFQRQQRRNRHAIWQKNSAEFSIFSPPHPEGNTHTIHTRKPTHTNTKTNGNIPHQSPPAHPLLRPPHRAP